MAFLYITEFGKQGRDASGYLNQNATPEEPPVAEQTVAIGGSSAQSAALNAGTSLVRIHADAICSISIGINPTAATTSRRMAAGQTDQITVPRGSVFKIAVITNT